MKKRTIFLTLIGLSFLQITNAYSQLYSGNAYYDSTGKIYYYADDGKAYYYPEDVQRQYQRKPQRVAGNYSSYSQSLIANKIEDCKQAYMKAKEKQNQLLDIEGLEKLLSPEVVDFANDGVMVEELYGNRIFIYTDDQEYATGDDFRAVYLYQKVGYYKYRTILGNINSVPAYKATKHRADEIEMDIYLKDKSLPCCINDHSDNRNNPLFGLAVKAEMGVPLCVNEKGKKIGKISFDSRSLMIDNSPYALEEWKDLEDKSGINTADDLLSPELMRSLTPEQIKNFIANGVDINARNMDGMTALHLAVLYNGNPEVIEKLLDYGANIEIKDYRDMSPLVLACAQGSNIKVVKALLDRGAKVDNVMTFDFLLLNSRIKKDEEYHKVLHIISEKMKQNKRRH